MIFSTFSNILAIVHIVVIFATLEMQTFVHNYWLYQITLNSYFIEMSHSFPPTNFSTSLQQSKPIQSFENLRKYFNQIDKKLSLVYYKQSGLILNAQIYYHLRIEFYLKFIINFLCQNTLLMMGIINSEFHLRQWNQVNYAKQIIHQKL